MSAKIALVCSVVIAPAVAFAVADGPDHFTTRNLAQGQSLTVRLGPSMSAAVSGSITAGARCIRNLGCNATTDAPPADGKPPETWCHVELGGVKGWAPAKYLAEASCQPPPVPPIPFGRDPRVPRQVGP